MLLIFMSVILLWKDNFWRYNYLTNYRVPDKVKFFFAGIEFIIRDIFHYRQLIVFQKISLFTLPPQEESSFQTLPNLGMEIIW